MEITDLTSSVTSPDDFDKEISFLDQINDFLNKEGKTKVLKIDLNRLTTEICVRFFGSKSFNGQKVILVLSTNELVEQASKEAEDISLEFSSSFFPKRFQHQIERKFVIINLPTFYIAMKCLYELTVPRLYSPSNIL